MGSRVDPLVGQLFAGRYHIEGLIAEGGMGKVYRARQDAPARTVALKVVRQDLAVGANAVERFRREMSATALIEHPHTVRVYDFGQSEHGELYYAMELLEGCTLRQALASGPLDPARVVHIARQIAKALGAAHAKGIVHRDIKPDNVMLTQPYGERDYVKVLDFGLARFAEAGPGERRDLTATGLVLGTPDYMAPEQAEDKEISARTDIYALGCVLYHLLSGSTPFTGTTPLRVLYQHLHEQPRPLEEVRNGVPAELRRLVSRMLAKAPDDRPASTHEVIASLDSVTRALGGSPPVDTTPVRPPVAWGAAGDMAPTESMQALPGPVSRRSALAWTATAAVVLGLAFGARTMLKSGAQAPGEATGAAIDGEARAAEVVDPKRETPIDPNPASDPSEARSARIERPSAAPLASALPVPDAGEGPPARVERLGEIEQRRLRSEELALAAPAEPAAASVAPARTATARDRARPTANKARPQPAIVTPSVQVKPW